MNHSVSVVNSYGMKLAYGGNNVALVHSDSLDKTVVRICTVVCNESVRNSRSGLGGAGTYGHNVISQTSGPLQSYDSQVSPPPPFYILHVKKSPPTSTQACTLAPTFPTLPTHNPLWLGYIWPSSSPSSPAQAQSCSGSRN